jgi:hypothetical protein
VNDHGEVVRSRIAGLHPAGDRADCPNCSVFNWTIGHVVPVPAETGASDGDLEEKYVTARVRIWLTYAQYKKLDAYIRQLQASNPTWNALWNNCVTFGRNVADAAGLKAPPMIWMTPETFVNTLASLNGINNSKQLPLRDAASGYAAPKKPPMLPKQKPDALRDTGVQTAAPAAPEKPAPAAGGVPAADVAAKPVETKPAEAKPADSMASEPATAPKAAASEASKPAADTPVKPAAKPVNSTPASPEKPKKKPVVDNTMWSSPAQAAAATGR